LGIVGDPADQLIAGHRASRGAAANAAPFLFPPLRSRRGNNGAVAGLMCCRLGDSEGLAFSSDVGMRRVKETRQNKATARSHEEESMRLAVKLFSSLGFVLAASVGVTSVASSQSADTSFFVTSNGIGNGGNLGGLAGADNHCQTLAQAAGAGAKRWRAYLSTQAADGAPAVNARDRIGKGPWRNARGQEVAKDVADLHAASNNLTKQTALSEKGDVINGRGDTPNRHDVLTGSQPDGTAFAAGEDRTCKNWTSSTQGSAMLGHSDRIGLRDDDASKSWNSSHSSRGPDGGCSQADLKSTGGDGLLYCFAAN
jgi:hypothetical protein